MSFVVAALPAVSGAQVEGEGCGVSPADGRYVAGDAVAAAGLLARTKDYIDGFVGDVTSLLRCPSLDEMRAQFRGRIAAGQTACRLRKLLDRRS
jgi:hypothetical protein